MKKAFTIFFLLITAIAHAQIGIGTASPDSKAALDITATGKGLLIPRMDSVSRTGISNPPDGLMVFQTDGRKGFWYSISNTWLYIPDKVNSGDNLGSHQATQNVILNDQNVQFRGLSDNNHGLGWYGNSGSTKNWLGQNIDGPVLYGGSGGALGTKLGTPVSILSWKSSGRVGINNADPQQALDVTGTAQATQFRYATSQTHILTIPVDAFTSVDPQVYAAYRLVNTANGNNSVPVMWLTGGTVGQAGYVSAPVMLPEGAVITNIKITGINNDGISSFNPSATISATATASGSSNYFIPFTATATITAEGDSWQDASASANNHVVQNDVNSYKVVVKLNQNTGNTVLNAVRITYTVISPD